MTLFHSSVYVEMPPADQLAVGDLLARRAVADDAVVDGAAAQPERRASRPPSRPARAAPRPRLRACAAPPFQMPVEPEAPPMLMVWSVWPCTMLTRSSGRSSSSAIICDPADFGALAHVDLADPADGAALRIDADVGGELVRLHRQARGGNAGPRLHAGQRDGDGQGPGASQECAAAGFDGHGFLPERSFAEE